MNFTNNINPYKSVLKDFIAIVAGYLVQLSLAPYNYSILAFLSTLLFIYSIQNCSLKRAVIRGYLYGCALFGFGINWIYISIHEHGNASPLLAGFLTMLLICVILAFYPTIKVWLYKLLENKFFNKQMNNTSSVLTFASIWVLIDWLQSWLFTGFPWLYLGYSQTTSNLASFAPIVSVYGLTWLIIFISGLAYLFLDNINQFINNNNNQYNLNKCLNYTLIVIIIFVMGTSLSGITWTTQNLKSERVALVQGNIAQSNRWSQEELANNIATYEGLTTPYWQNRTIIWPESAVNIALPYGNDLVSKWQQIALKNNSTMILGIPRVANNQHQYFNSIMAIGKGDGVYNKTKLVPWGEYVPFENIFRGIIDFFNLPMSSFISGNIYQPYFNTLSSPNIQWLPFICYEIAYPSYVINHAHAGDAIITISNDTWFGDSSGPWQHLQLAQMRALETARPVVRATNNGVTAIITPNGQISKRIEQFKADVLIDDAVYGYQGITPIMYYGVNTIMLLCLIIIALCCYLPMKLKSFKIYPA
jgi:apolipoprotein N-acyltransferase